MQKLVADTIHYLTDLVSYNSVSHEANLPIITYIQNILLNAGVESMVLPSPDGRKANLLARIGSEVAGGIVLSGHTDVVPVEGQPWETDPFILTEKDGKLFGRGSADMKSFIAACLAFIPEFKKLPLKKPIYFAFSYDEEIGCLGVPHLLKYITAQVPKPAFAIIGEPTLMQVVTAHKGVLSFETTVHGLEWHSSQPHYGVNAVHIACDLVHYLSLLAKELSRTGMKDERFDPPHSTVHVGIIHGGTARNIIPRECHFNWEIRPLPTDNADVLAERFKDYCTELQQAHPGSSITTVPKSRMMGVTLPAHATEASQMVMHCARKNQEHAVAFGTEAGVFNEYGIPAIVCGPGNIEQAHKPNEFIEISQLEACADFLLRLCEQVR